MRFSEILAHFNETSVTLLTREGGLKILWRAGLELTQPFLRK